VGLPPQAPLGTVALIQTMTRADAVRSRPGGAYVPTLVVGMDAAFGVVGRYPRHDLHAESIYTSPPAGCGPDEGRIHRDQKRRDVRATRDGNLIYVGLPEGAELVFKFIKVSYCPFYPEGSPIECV